MPNIIQINSLIGASPFNIYVCDDTITYCYFVSGVTSVPFIFDVPPPLDQSTPIILKVIDYNNCEKIFLLGCQEIYEKEYEDSIIFLFQDADIYLFQGP